eukprot:COSAG06_NODE_70190_length_193_cov_44.936170_1_plen_30_part_01
MVEDGVGAAKDEGPRIKVGPALTDALRSVS